MSEDESTYSVKGDAEFESKKTKVVVKVDKDEIKDEIKQELKHEEDEGKLIAFIENLKSEFSEKYPAYADLFEAATSPVELHEILEQARTEKKVPTEKKIPMGKAPFISSAGAGHGSSVEMLDSLYDKAYLNSSKYDKEEVEDAKQKINTLWESMIGSKSWSQLKEGGTRKIEQHKISSCPQCGFTLVDRNDCPNCGYDPTEKQKVVKTRTFKSPDSRQF
jgi:rubrerythrin